MKIGLFIPCYIDQFYPNVAISTLELLEKLECEVGFPLQQTCCGQPMANAGFAHLTGGCNINFIKNFEGFDYIVSPSGSCVLHIKEHLKDEKNDKSIQHIKKNIYELTEFLTDVLRTEMLDAFFPYKVGLHVSCHGQRGLHLSSMSELVSSSFSKPEKLLHMVRGIKLYKPVNTDDCCGFGGTFCITEEAVSVKMGKARIREHLENGIEYITGGDTSCLMHLEGILRRQGLPAKVIHIAEILNAKNND
jgi:L-lactate dehydrogenase complex protein LldE